MSEPGEPNLNIQEEQESEKLFTNPMEDLVLVGKKGEGRGKPFKGKMPKVEEEKEDNPAKKPKNEKDDESEDESGEDDKEEKDDGSGSDGEKSDEEEESGEDKKEGGEGDDQEDEKEEGMEPGDSQESQENPWGDVFEPKPSPIDRDTVEAFIKAQKEKQDQAKEAKKKKEKQLTPQEKASQAQREQDERFAVQHKLNPETIAQYRVIEKSIEPYKKELAEVFENLMQSISAQIVLAWEKGFRSGRFRVSDFIEKYAGYVNEQKGVPLLQFDQLDVHDQREFIEKLELFPEKMKVRLVLDGSGSMSRDRIIALQQISVLIMESLSVFEKTINLRFPLKNKVRIDTELRMFGSPGSSTIIKPFSEKKNYNLEEDLADRVRAFPHINNGYGNTCDAEPWWLIDQSLKDEEYVQDLKEGRAREFVFEVTDGGSNNISRFAQGNESSEQDTVNAIAAVKNKGVIAYGFQVGNPGGSDQQVFDNIWGDHGTRIAEISQLIAAMTKNLESEMEKISFKLHEVGED